MELVLALVVLLVLIVLLGLKIVPQSENFVVTRLGAYHRTLDAGVSVIIPFLDRVHSKVPVNDQVLNDIELEVVSADNVVYGAQLLVVYRIENPEAAVFRVNSINALVIGLVQSLVRSELGKVELDAVQSRPRVAERGTSGRPWKMRGATYGIRISAARKSRMCGCMKPRKKRWPKCWLPSATGARPLAAPKGCAVPPNWQPTPNYMKHNAAPMPFAPSREANAEANRDDCRIAGW
jgi:hypothetical protein